MSLASVSPDYLEVLKEKYSHHERLLGYVASQPYTEYSRKELLKYVDFHDQHRKLSWRETFTEIRKFFE
jgi:membrane-bound lytic murein transglycosylase MltF